jgi:type IV secretion system protein VirD4
MNYQKSGKDLMTVDEIAVMDGDKCILQLRGVRPFLSDKYDVTQHPLYKETGEYDARNKLDIQRFLHQGIKVKSGEMFDVVRI